MKKKASYQSILLLAILLLLVMGRGNVTSAANKNVVTKTSMILIKDESYKLKAKFNKKNAEYYWESRNPDVVMVDSKTGVVTAISKGKTMVDFYLNGKRVGKCYIRVETPALNIKKKSMDITDTMKLKVKGTLQKVTFSSEDSSILTVTEDGEVKAIAPGSTKITALLTNPKSNRKTKLNCEVKVRNTKLIALTFDDGPGPSTPIVLDALEKYDSKATFFVVGSQISDKTKGYVKRAYDLGCEIGNHTYSHLNIPKTSVNKVIADVKKNDQLVKAITGSTPFLMRPPYGAITKEAQEKLNKAQVTWCLDTLDWKYRNTSYVTNYVLTHASDGDIILMHDIHPTTAKAVEPILKGLKNKGFKLVTVSELAQARGKTLVAHEKYNGFKKNRK